MDLLKLEKNGYHKLIDKMIRSSQTQIYPIAGPIVDGLTVRDGVPNIGSISASFTDYEVLSGIREVPLSDFSGAETFFYDANDKRRSEGLAGKIAESGEIAPLIVAIDKEGPYILEGAHRFVALSKLGKKTFPALVVIDQDESLGEIPQELDTDTSPGYNTDAGRGPEPRDSRFDGKPVSL